MKKFTTSIFVPGKTKKELTLNDAMVLGHRLNTPAVITLCEHGGLDEIVEGEEFILVVNGEHHKHEIKLKGTHKVGGKLRLAFSEPEKEEVKRFAEWRFKSQYLLTSNHRQSFQLKNFTVHDLRRLIRHAVGNGERQLVNYR